MKQPSLLKATFAIALALCAHAYLEVEEGALNVRHIHMVKRAVNGEIVGRAFSNTYEILDARGGRQCQTISACATPGGCALMAPQTYCKGESVQESFQKAVKQTGANGMTSLKLIGESIGRGPVGSIIGATKTTTKALAEAKKEKAKALAKGGKKGKKAASKKGGSKPKKGGAKPKKQSKKPSPKKKAVPKKSNNRKHKRDLAGEDVLEVVNKRDFEVVERDEDMNLIERAKYSMFDVVARDEDGKRWQRFRSGKSMMGGGGLLIPSFSGGKWSLRAPPPHSHWKLVWWTRFLQLRWYPHPLPPSPLRLEPQADLAYAAQAVISESPENQSCRVDLPSLTRPI
ncbi:hypothetical protein FA13DRAFT_1853385 [Coprinellus micaceus]|uniref:Uncharacterized protein n=1 Tax=Coprinellus micaceus TaxID=71717 RepID=A0A4Y7T9I8_COPMI|nr:hypothetical protein FA13DRAFT_1853385 [Coprinellus micaceus]